jgi:integrase
MSINLIKPLAFKHLKPTETEQNISDGGGLYIRVRKISDGGGISFRYRFSFNGKQDWLTMKSSDLVEARKERDNYKEMLKNGINPKLELVLEKERAHKQQLAEQEALAKQAARATVHDLFYRWHDTDLIKRKDVKEVVRMFEKDVLPLIGHLFVEDVRKGHISLVTDKLLARGVNRMAKMIFSLMRQMFGFAVDRDIIEFNPTANLKKAKIGGKDVERDRFLTEDEIRALARQMPEAKFIVSTECAVWIVLATGCRIGELSKAKFAEIDFAAKTWTIPNENSKNGKAHVIYLSDFALKQFERITQVSRSEVWIFPNRDKSNHVSEKSLNKQMTDRQNEKPFKSRTQQGQALVLSGGRWTAHDLRRTCSTLMGKLNISGDVIEKCLNHTEENKIKRIYQRHDLKEQQQHAWLVLGERLELLTSPQDNVIPFKKTA